MEAPQGLSVSWDVVTDEHTSCARRSIVYDISVVGSANIWTIVSTSDVENTRIEIPDSLLESNQNYTVYIRARLVQGICETREAGTIVCRTSDELSTTAPPGIAT